MIVIKHIINTSSLVLVSSSSHSSVRCFILHSESLVHFSNYTDEDLIYLTLATLDNNIIITLYEHTVS